MKHYVLGLLLLAGVSVSSYQLSYAQTAPAAANQQAANPIIIKPTMPIEYVVFASNALTTIEIQGSEVDGYLACKNTLDTELKKYIAEKKRPEDVVTFGIQLEIAQNLITLLNRAKLTGNEAPKFKGFINALVTAGKNYKPESSK